MTAEEERTRLICDIARVLRDGPVPDDARAAALTFIGWLARRMPGEPVSMCDLSRCSGFASVITSNGMTSNGAGSNGMRSNGSGPSSQGPRSSRVPRSAR